MCSAHLGKFTSTYSYHSEIRLYLLPEKRSTVEMPLCTKIDYSLAKPNESNHDRKKLPNKKSEVRNGSIKLWNIHHQPSTPAR